MRKTIVHFIAFTIFAVSCKKDAPKYDPKSAWDFNGVSYKGFAKTYPISSEFSASERVLAYGVAPGNFIAINFSFNHMPARNGIYNVKASASDSTECEVTVGEVGRGALYDYTSVDSTAQVTITVSTSGRLSASFSNVVLSNYNRTEVKTVSGSLEEQ